MAAPTAEEEQLLKDFRERVKDILETEEHQKDSFLLRWLRARELNLNNAENMLRNSLNWRKENRVDSLLDEPMDPYIVAEFPFHFAGVDKKGQPIVILPIGKWDFRKCAAQGKTEEFKHFVNHRFEEACLAIKKCDKVRPSEAHPITQFTVLMDWKGYSYMQLCNLKAIQNMLYTGVTYEAHYPEVLCSCVMINCPSFFNIVMALIKGILAKKTYEKITFYGTNKEEWETACKKIIDDDQFVEVSNVLT